MKFIKYNDRRQNERYMPITSIQDVRFVDNSLKSKSFIVIVPIANVLWDDNDAEIKLWYPLWDKYYKKVKNYFLKNS